jgi:hypothetical protein
MRLVTVSFVSTEQGFIASKGRDTVDIVCIVMNSEGSIDCSIVSHFSLAWTLLI